MKDPISHLSMDSFSLQSEIPWICTRSLVVAQVFGFYKYPHGTDLNQENLNPPGY